MRAALLLARTFAFCLFTFALLPRGGNYLEREALAVAHELDFVLLPRLHLRERLCVVVYVLNVAARELDYQVPRGEPRGLRGRALAHAFELEAVGRVRVRRNRPQRDAEARAARRRVGL